jgi:hypothetical protein
MSTWVQGCIDCGTPMIDMENCGNCPNCEGHNIGPICMSVTHTVAAPRSQPKLFVLEYRDSGYKPVTIYVEANDTQEARKMLCYWSEKEGKALVDSVGQSLRFWPRTHTEDKSRWQKMLNRSIKAKRYHGDTPREYLARDSHDRVVKKSLITA